MKIVFTQKEVEEIILAQVKRQYGVKVDQVTIETYSMDYCVVTQSPELQAELATPVISLSPFEGL